MVNKESQKKKTVKAKVDSQSVSNEYDIDKNESVNINSLGTNIDNQDSLPVNEISEILTESKHLKKTMSAKNPNPNLKTVLMQIRLHKTLKDRVLVLCERDYTSMSEIFRTALRLYLQNKGV